MSEAATAAPAAKAKKAATEVTKVKMKDGREADFAGKRNLNKGFECNWEKGEVTATFDFRTGDTLSLTVDKNDPMILQLAGHGLIQKAGDETAGVKDEQGNPDVPSMVLAVESILTRLANTEASIDDRWYAESEGGGGFSGAAVVIKAICEVSGQSLEQVKAFLERKLKEGEAQKLTRQKLYAAYRKPGSKTAAVIKRLEEEKLAAQTSSIDPDADMAELMAA
jgi:hypothetical protein